MDAPTNTAALHKVAEIDSRPVDPFALVLFGGLAALVIVVWLLGRFYPGSGLEQLGMRTAREISETREALEAQDLDQMVAARNARRRARGEPEVSPEEVELQVAREIGAQAQRRERYRVQQDIDDLLAVTNARRRARGLPERTREDVEAELKRSDPAARSGP